MKHNKKKKLLAVLLVCTILTGCNNGSSPSETTASEQSSASVSKTTATTPASAASTESGSTPVEISTPPVPSEETDEPIPTEETIESSSTLESNTTPAAEVQTDETDTTSQYTQTSEPKPTEAAPPAETTPTVTTSETTAKPAPKPPAEVVIPDIEMPTSPNKDVISGEFGTIDYSNSSKGYISVTYNGAAPKVKLRLAYGENTYNHDVPVDGSTEYYPLSCGSGNYTVSLFENVEANMYSTAAQETISVKIKNETGVFLYPNRYVKFDSSSACVKKAAELCAGMSAPIDKIAAIFDYVQSSTTYDKQLAATAPSGYVPFPDNTLSSKKGICYDYSSLFAAMARSQGIPTRICVGYASPDIYHAWNEVYTKETGWITPELFLDRKGYNLVDATFYSGAKDKAQISEYIMNNTNYSVIYYY